MFKYLPEIKAMLAERAELERLRMENKLLRDFLQFVGRK